MKKLKKLMVLFAFFSLIHNTMGQDLSLVDLADKNILSEDSTEQITNVKHGQIDIDGLSIFYRESGRQNNETILMLHGLPSSSHMYRKLIEELGDTHHIIAPDYPGFGFSDAPSIDEFEYSFDNITKVVQGFIDELGIESFYLMMHDYGGPIGMRIATNNPDRIKGLIIQNANIYMDGLGEWPQKMAGYMQKEQFEELGKFKNYLLSAEGIKEQYFAGSNNPQKIDPISYLTDIAFFDRENIRNKQIVLFDDYGTNPPKYPEWQNFLRTNQPKTLVLWGEHDKFFSKPGGEAYRKDLKEVDIHFFDGGHFILEEFPQESIALIKKFLSKK